MQVVFKCKQSGNTVSFKRIEDIELMRKNVDYDEVKSIVKTEESEIPEEIGTITLDSIKKRGRPFKVR